MSLGTRAQTRKRQSQPDFDNIDIGPHTLSKIRKIGKSPPKMATLNENPYDSSAIINTAVPAQRASSNQVQNERCPSTSTSTGSSSSEEESIVRETATNETATAPSLLEVQFRKMQHDMNSLMKIMGELTKTVENVARINNKENEGSGPQTTLNNTGNVRNSLSYLNPEIEICPVPNGKVVTNPNLARDQNYPPITPHGMSTNPSQMNYGVRPNGGLNGEQIRIRVDKFGIVFDGNTSHMSVDDFIFRLERLQAQYDIPWAEILRDFRLLVVGQAHEWFWLYTKTHVIHDWPGLRHALESQYQTVRSNFELMRDLAERRQQNHESIDSFFLTMGQLRSKLLQPIAEYEMIKIMKKNVKESVGRIVYPMMISSVEQLRMECNEAERNFPRRDMRNIPPPQRPIRHVNEVYMNNQEYPYADDEPHLYEDMTEIAAMNTDQSHVKQCWNCQSHGHVFMECPSSQRSLFCYRCGKPGVTKPRCPVCNLENQKRGVGTTGNPRRTENPAMANP